ncbi:DUF4058 family protein [Stieleria varia]|uniref:DUF4058 domain-containing protein n=1 Tax=Stieleria varia TaxID=2528005 RepID=A0A5C6ANW6_9BACT|nr:DUF4058 family protein [Stieleria varia]TWU00796.1 hypothetical protein Pla52n_41650 [Stieleria varia]
MQTTNPFPGMNPYLQARWPDAHTRLIAYIGDAISESLPGDLTVVAEESVSIDAPDEMVELSLRADVEVAEVSDIQIPDRDWGASEAATVAIDSPVLLRATRKHTHRWLEIRDTEDRVITVIEVLSPSNKTPDAAKKFARRQDSLLLSGVNTLEIDLIRGGKRTVPDAFLHLLQETDSTMYLIVAGRAHDVEGREVYYSPIDKRIPVVGVPLRQTDEDVALDLQPLVDRCYQTGRYWQLAQRPLPEPEWIPAEKQWAEGLLAKAGLRKPS